LKGAATFFRHLGFSPWAFPCPLPLPSLVKVSISGNHQQFLGRNFDSERRKKGPFRYFGLASKAQLGGISSIYKAGKYRLTCGEYHLPLELFSCAAHLSSKMNTFGCFVAVLAVVCCVAVTRDCLRSLFLGLFFKNYDSFQRRLIR
jgi:hypothetical protein